MALQPQFRTGKWTFLLDGRVVETFYEGTTTTTRMHVDHLRIDGRADGAGIKVEWGIEVSGRIINGGRMAISEHEVAAFNAFVALAVANRTPA